MESEFLKIHKYLGDNLSNEIICGVKLTAQSQELAVNNWVLVNCPDCYEKRLRKKREVKKIEETSVEAQNV